MKRKIIRWICLGAFVLGASQLLLLPKSSADIFGGDVAVLSQILIRTIQQIEELRTIIGNTRETVSVLNEMNRGVKETLRIAKTAHIPLPPQVYAQAKTIEQAAATAQDLYGHLPNQAPVFGKKEFQSGVEGMSLSEEAFDYSSSLDSQGETIKASALVASPSAATRLTAETLGVVLQAIDQGNRIEAKSLEYSSTDRIKNSAIEAAKLQSFVETEDTLSRDFSDRSLTPLNSIFDDPGIAPETSANGGIKP